MIWPKVRAVSDRFPAGQRMGARAYLRHMARIRGLTDLSVIDPPHVDRVAAHLGTLLNESR